MDGFDDIPDQPTDDLPAPFSCPMSVTFAPLNAGPEATRLAIRAALKQIGRIFNLKVLKVERAFDDDSRWIRCAGGIEAVEACAQLIHARRKAEAKAKRKKKPQPQEAAA